MSTEIPYKKLGDVQDWPLAHIIHTRTRVEFQNMTDLTRRAMRPKIDLAIARITTQGFRGCLAARLLPDGITAEIAEGNHRVPALEEMKRTTVPIQLYDCTEEEFTTLYLLSNSGTDEQTINWALSSVRAACATHEDRLFQKKVAGKKKSPYDAPSAALQSLANKMGCSAKSIHLLRDMNKALDAGILVPEIILLQKVHTALDFWKRMVAVFKVTSVQVTHKIQKDTIEGLLEQVMEDGIIRDRYEDKVRYIRDQMDKPKPEFEPLPGKARGRTILTLEDRIYNLGVEIATITRQFKEAEDVEDDDSQAILAAARAGIHGEVWQDLQVQWAELMTYFPNFEETSDAESEDTTCAAQSQEAD